MRLRLLIVCMSLTVQAVAQTREAPQLAQPPGPAGPPVVVTLRDALDRAKMVDAQLQSAVSGVAIAREDRLQAKASLLPGVSQTTQYQLTQGNGVLSSGRFVSNDGVHVYRSWGVLHQEIGADTFTQTSVRQARAAEALAAARLEIAERGLAVAVTDRYYRLVSSQRGYATAQQAVDQSQMFLGITQQQENAGQVAHSDVVKAQIQYEQQRLGFLEATLAMDAARLNLAVLLFPNLNENYTVVDDLDSAQALPSFPEIQTMAARANPQLRAAQEILNQASLDVRGTRNALFPSLSIDANYGIEANAFAFHSAVAAAPEAGPLPNLGFYVVGTVNVPVFDWGARRSRVRQAEVREQQARVELTQTQRQLAASLYAFYNEALTARAAVDGARRAADLASESLRLVNLRYQAGESTALEVVDAQKTVVDARNSYDDTQARYRVAIAALQTLSGSF